MDSKKKFLAFTLQNHRFAFLLDAVERIVPVVEITELNSAPEYILGMIDYHGEILPVVNIRKLFDIPEKEIELNDKLIIARSKEQKFTFLSDNSGEIIEKGEDEIIQAEKITSGIKYVRGVLKMDDGLILIYDLDYFMKPEELSMLKRALEKHGNK